MVNRSNFDLRKYIIEHLSAAGDPNDLILNICNQTGMKWPEAESLVNRIQSEDQREIARKQSPLLIVIAIVMFIGGIGIFGYEAYILMTLVSDYMRIRKDPLVILDLVNFAPNYVILFFEATPIALGMVLGSLIGMRAVWSSILFPAKPTD